MNGFEKIIKDIEFQADLSNQQKQKPQSVFVSAKVLYEKDIENIPTLIEPILPKAGIVCIAGASDTGKSAFLRFLGLSIVGNKPDFLGMPINAVYNKVIYVSTEDDDLAVSYLIRKQNKEMNIGGELLDNMKFLFDTQDLISKLDTQLSEEPVDVVFIDCFSDLYGGEMNQNNKVRTFLNQFEQLANKYHCLFFFLHHCGKHTEMLMPSKNNLIGSQGLEAKMRLVLELRTDLQNSNIKHLCVVKGNYLPAKYKYESYDLRFDENMCFTDTGTRTPFEQLAKVDDMTAEKYTKTLEMKQQGMSMQSIAEELGYKNKSSVSRLMSSVACCKTLGKSNEQRNDNKDVARVLRQSNDKQQQSNNDAKLPF
jgi:RecA-family ATPase